MNNRLKNQLNKLKLLEKNSLSQQAKSAKMVISLDLLLGMLDFKLCLKRKVIKNLMYLNENNIIKVHLTYFVILACINALFGLS